MDTQCDRCGKEFNPRPGFADELWAHVIMFGYSHGEKENFEEGATEYESGDESSLCDDCSEEFDKLWKGFMKL